jgi:hypothetical protein
MDSFPDRGAARDSIDARSIAAEAIMSVRPHRAGILSAMALSLSLVACRPGSDRIAEAPVFFPMGGTYASPQAVSIRCANEAAAIYYTIDGSAPSSAAGLMYDGAVTVAATETIKAIAYLGGWEDSPVTSASFIITGTVAGPVFDPAAGFFVGVQAVGIASPDPDAAIYYTTDGSPPTIETGILYADAVPVSSTQTLTAIACKPGWTNSAAVSARYAIDLGLYGVAGVPGFPADVFKASAFATLCIEGMANQAFPELGTDWLGGFRYDINLADSGLSAYNWSIQTSSSSATMTILTFSRYTGAEKTALDEPYDDHTILKLFMHELSHGYLNKYLWEKKGRNGGWAFYDSGTPGWLTQGFGEYLSIMYADDHLRTVTRAKYIDYFKITPELVVFDTIGDAGISTPDEYKGGAALIMFLYDSYGRQKMMELLSSSRPTFSDALSDLLGGSGAQAMGGVKARWDAWLAGL